MYLVIRDPYKTIFPHRYVQTLHRAQYRTRNSVYSTYNRMIFTTLQNIIYFEVLVFTKSLKNYIMDIFKTSFHKVSCLDPFTSVSRIKYSPKDKFNNPSHSLTISISDRPLLHTKCLFVKENYDVRMLSVLGRT